MRGGGGRDTDRQTEIQRKKGERKKENPFPMTVEFYLITRKDKSVRKFLKVTFRCCHNRGSLGQKCALQYLRPPQTSGKQTSCPAINWGTDRHRLEKARAEKRVETRGHEIRGGKRLRRSFPDNITPVLKLA